MESLSDERGQSLMIAVIVLAIAAAAIVGLRIAQDRVVAAARVQRAGEAAVAAAAQSLADAYVARLSSVRSRPHETRSSVNALVTDPRTLEAAREAADALARENGAGAVQSLEAICSGGHIEARLVLAGHPHRAGFAAPECSPP
jgi:hypothetical protein